MRIIAFGVVLFAITLTDAASQERYVCVSDQSTGFRWDGKKWAITKFNVSGERFLVEQVPKRDFAGESINFVVKQFGQSNEKHTCRRTETDKFVSSRILCGGLGVGMLIDTKTLRFQDLYGLGYIDGSDTSENTPNLTIGTCVRLN